MIVVERPNITLQVSLLLDEKEAKALYLLASFDHNVIRELLSEKMTKDLSGDHKAGLMSSLEGFSAHIGPALDRLKNAREAFNPKPKEAP